MRIATLWALVAACGSSPSPIAAPEPRRPPARFVKGQLHLHSDHSGDSETPPETVARWYADAGYDFIVFTDHNRVTSGVVRDDLVIAAGSEITLNTRTCDPAPEGPLCPLHVNALFVDPARAGVEVPLPTDLRRTSIYRHGIARARAMGGLAQINHPNFHYGADLDTLAALVDDAPLLLEVANLAVDSNNDGDATHPSTEELWDGLLARGARVWGTATDDAHHYDDADAVAARGEPVFVGDRGFVMVRAPAEPKAIRAAIERGDFWSSSGAMLDDVGCRRGELRVWPEDPRARVICRDGDGTRPAERDASAHVCRARAGWTRAVIDDRAGARAWTQPCWP